MNVGGVFCITCCDREYLCFVLFVSSLLFIIYWAKYVIWVDVGSCLSCPPTPLICSPHILPVLFELQKEKEKGKRETRNAESWEKRNVFLLSVLIFFGGETAAMGNPTASRQMMSSHSQLTSVVMFPHVKRPTVHIQTPHPCIIRQHPRCIDTCLTQFFPVVFYHRVNLFRTGACLSYQVPARFFSGALNELNASIMTPHILLICCHT